MPEPAPHPTPSPLAAGLACRCPACGRGRLYDGFLKVAQRCAACGLDLGKADSGDGPAVFVTFILGFLMVPLALLLEAKAAPPMWVHLTIWPGAILGGALALLRPAKGVLIALQYRHGASQSATLEHD